ncbi:hypothetical protein DASB73_041760 [Starmerella bacillaris]|uniref:Uncharacterized protein n=1 Tax=Starmerella bacillaris TaxID=1247836 RepID=A0AAV5RPV1_STABA|nr:hypothetical protein DASB73_041760 [Starmerella bacillaris]
MFKRRDKSKAVNNKRRSLETLKPSEEDLIPEETNQTQPQSSELRNDEQVSTSLQIYIDRIDERLKKLQQEIPK